MQRYTVYVAGTGLGRLTSLICADVAHTCFTPRPDGLYRNLRVIASLDFAANTVLMINGDSFIMLLLLNAPEWMAALTTP
jgi:hypothetical protein